MRDIKLEYSKDQTEITTEGKIYTFKEAPIGYCCDSCDMKKVCSDVKPVLCFPKGRKDYANGYFQYLVDMPVKINDTRTVLEKAMVEFLLG